MPSTKDDKLTNYYSAPNISMNNSLVILFPKVFNQPAGGAKVVLEYANRLAKDGYDITVIYSAAVFWRKRSVKHKIRLIIKYIVNSIAGYSCKKWFSLDKAIKEKLVLSLNWKYVSNNSASYLATAAETAVYLNDYPIDSKLKYYFIQGYETWALPERELRNTYHFDMNRFVVSKWLSHILEEENVDHTIISNGFDFNYFHLSITPENRNDNSVCLMYSPLYLKGFSTAYDAVIRLSKELDIDIKVFGVFERPDFLPDFIRYYKSPCQDVHNMIYNTSAIFIGSSLEEGWGLPVGEAMICGCAVICTDIKGYREMASEDNAIIVAPNDSESIYSALKMLILNPSIRITLAKKSIDSIKSFSIDTSYAILKHHLDKPSQCYSHS